MMKVGPYREAMLRFKRDLITATLKQTSGNRAQAARILQISRQALAKALRELEISIPSTTPQAVGLRRWWETQDKCPKDPRKELICTGR